MPARKDRLGRVVRALVVPSAPFCSECWRFGAENRGYVAFGTARGRDERRRSLKDRRQGNCALAAFLALLPSAPKKTVAAGRKARRQPKK